MKVPGIFFTMSAGDFVWQMWSETTLTSVQIGMLETVDLDLQIFESWEGENVFSWAKSKCFKKKRSYVDPKTFTCILR